MSAIKQVHWKEIVNFRTYDSLSIHDENISLKECFETSNKFKSTKHLEKYPRNSVVFDLAKQLQSERDDYVDAIE